MFKLFLIGFLYLFQIKSFSLPWNQYQFTEMSKEIDKCVYRIGWGDSAIPKSPLVAPVCEDDLDVKDLPGPWDKSYIIVNKSNNFIVINKPISKSNLLKVGLDFAHSSYSSLQDPKLILQNGDRYAQLCFYISLARKDQCVINMYVDLLEGKVTIPESGNYGAPFILDSLRGIRAFTNTKNEMDKNKVIIKKMFSEHEKEIIIPTPNFSVRGGQFLSKNRIQIYGYLIINGEKRVKQTKEYRIDPSQLDD